MIKNILLVGLGGGAGSIIRYVIQVLIAKNTDAKFPIATILVNIMGSLMIGIIMGYLHKTNQTDGAIKYLLAIGFCGGFTTFSAFAFENFNLLSNNNLLISLTYITSSVIICVIAVYLGYLIIR